MGIRPGEHTILASLIQGKTNIINLSTETPKLELGDDELRMVSVLDDFIQKNQGSDGLGPNLLQKIFALASAFDSQNPHDMENSVKNTRLQVEASYGEYAQAILHALSTLFVPTSETFPTNIWTEPIDQKK